VTKTREKSGNATKYVMHRGKGLLKQRERQPGESGHRGEAKQQKVDGLEHCRHWREGGSQSQGSDAEKKRCYSVPTWQEKTGLGSNKRGKVSSKVTSENSTKWEITWSTGEGWNGVLGKDEP